MGVEPLGWERRKVSHVGQSTWATYVGVSIFGVLVVSRFFFPVDPYPWLKRTACLVIAISRPLWDKPPDPWRTVLQNYGYIDQQSCTWYPGWKPRSPLPPPPGQATGALRNQSFKIFDTFMFNTELDLLEIRLEELAPYIDYFVILESGRTITNLPKQLFLKKYVNDTQFARFKSQIIHVVLEDSDFRACINRGDCRVKHPFSFEAFQRRSLMDAVVSHGLQKGDVIIVGDLDEIPRREVVQLYRECEGQPALLNLKMDYYLYSFEFKQRESTDKTAIRMYDPSATEVDWLSHHKRQGSTVLVDAGWHCSWCFRTLDEYVFKMYSFAHADRRDDPTYEDKSEIQRRICRGDNLFDLWPESYQFSEVFAELFLKDRQEGIAGLPELVRKEPYDFLFLLPGGCRRR